MCYSPHLPLSIQVLLHNAPHDVPERFLRNTFRHSLNISLDNLQKESSKDPIIPHEVVGNPSDILDIYFKRLLRDSERALSLSLRI